MSYRNDQRLRTRARHNLRPKAILDRARRPEHRDTCKCRGCVRVRYWGKPRGIDPTSVAILVIMCLGVIGAILIIVLGQGLNS